MMYLLFMMLSAVTSVHAKPEGPFSYALFDNVYGSKQVNRESPDANLGSSHTVSQGSLKVGFPFILLADELVVEIVVWAFRRFLSNNSI